MSKKKKPVKKGSKKSAPARLADFSDEQIIKAAEDMNDIMGLDPEIDVEGSREDIIDGIIKESAEISKDDEFSKKTWALLRALKVAPEEEEAEEPEKPEPKKKAPKKKVVKKAAKKDEGKKKPPKKVAKKKDEGKKKPPKKAAKKAGKKPRKKKPEKKQSNKAVVYAAFEEGNENIAKLSRLIGGAVKDATLKSWVSAWKRGKNFPSCARK